MKNMTPPLTDIVEAIERVRLVLGEMPLEAFEADWEKQWLVERGVEIISEASRRLTDELKARHPIFRGRRSPALATYCATTTRASPRRSCGSSRVKTCLTSNESVVTSWQPQASNAEERARRYLP